MGKVYKKQRKKVEKLYKIWYCVRRGTLNYVNSGKSLYKQK